MTEISYLCPPKNKLNMPRPLGYAACYPLGSAAWLVQERDARTIYLISPPYSVIFIRTDERSKRRAMLTSAMPCKEEVEHSSTPSRQVLLLR